MGNLVMVKNFPDRSFAEQAREILLNKDIPSVLKSPDAGILGTTNASMSNGVNLYVEEKHLERAGELLNALFNGI